MEPLGFLADLLVVFLISGVVVYVFHRAHVPAVVGLLAAGVAIGPSGLSLVHEVERIQLLAEIGVVVLLFTVGLEFSLPRLWSMSPLMLRVGIPQVLLSGAVAALCTAWIVPSVGAAVLIGMLISMSSTAIVLKVLTDRGELSSPQGRLSVAVLLFQDLLVVVFTLLIPLLAGQAGDIPVGWALLRGLGVVALVLVLARFAVPPLLYQVVRTRNRELFLILLIVLCLGTALLTASVGLSLALGAFLAGLALSESEYVHQTLAEAIPFRDIFGSLFFVSVGMLLDIAFAFRHFPLVAGAVIGVLLLKTLAAAVPTALVGYPPRIALLTGVAIAQVGEFSFVLASRGRELGLLGADHFQVFLAVAVLTIALTPPLVGGLTPFASRLKALADFEDWQSAHRGGDSPAVETRQAHAIICGYGVSGRTLVRILRATGIPYAVLEMNPATVRIAQAEGERIYYGDCTRPTVLEHLGVRTARLLVVAISDPASTRGVVRLARQMNPVLHILARSRYVAEVDELRRLGANQVVPEELQTAVEIFARVLREYEVPRNLILELIDRVRADHYEMLRIPQMATGRAGLSADVLSKVAVESCLLRAGSPAIGQTVRELALREVTGANLVAVRREGELLLNLSPDLRLEAGDVAVVIGGHAEVARGLTLLDPTVGRPLGLGTSADEQLHVG